MRSNKYLREKWKGSIFFPQTCTALAKHYQGVSFQILRFHIFAQNYLEIVQFHVICAWYIKRFCVNTFNNCLWPCTLTWCQKVCWPCPEGKVSDLIWARAYIGTHHTLAEFLIVWLVIMDYPWYLLISQVGHWVNRVTVEQSWPWTEPNIYSWLQQKDRIALLVKKILSKNRMICWKYILDNKN